MGILHAMAIPVILAAFIIGYQWPRDVEIESLKPVEFHYQITPEAAKYLLVRDGPKCEAQL